MRFLLLLVIFTSLYMGYLGAPGVIDYDEGVYAEVSREMFVKHEAIIPTLNNEGFFEKPPLLYWGQMLGYGYFGTTAFGARFVNALAGIATILLVFLAGRKPLGPETAFRAALILGSSLFCVYLSRIAMTDMPLTFLFTLCLCLSWLGVERHLQDKQGAPLFWAGCAVAGLAMLTKGAIGALLPLVTAVLYLLSIGKLPLLWKRNWFIPGALLLLVIGFSWYLLLGFHHPGGFTFMKELFIKQHIGRFTTPLEGHSGPIYFYLVVLLIGFMPWSFFLPLAAIRAPYRDSTSSRVRFLRLFLLFFLVTFVFFSVAATKLPNYICPALPGIAMLAATLFDETEKRGKLVWSVSTYLAALLILALGIVLLASPLIIAHLPQMLGKSALKAPILSQPVSLGFMPYLSGLLLIAAGGFLIYANRTKSASTHFASLSGTALAVSAVLFLLVVPVYDSLINQPLVRLAEQAAAKTPDDGRIVMFEVSSRPSVNFYAHRLTIDCGLSNLEALRQSFANPKIQVGITTDYYFGKLKEAGVAVEQLTSDHGYILFRLAPDQPAPEGPPLSEQSWVQTVPSTAVVDKKSSALYVCSIPL
ncbi:MAG: glycosyltransferase family 39 protein [Desulfocapsaceae bacterium]|nr:glycosyltransferase family 39 protein [Desulfocapsaceae bacterium]